MGHEKIEIRKIESTRNKQATFSKCRVGFLKKVYELSILYDAKLGIIIFSNIGKLFKFSSVTSKLMKLASSLLSNLL